MIAPHVEPEHMKSDATGRIHVLVHQVVRDLAGNTLADQHVQHVYRMDKGLVQRMEIHEA